MTAILISLVAVTAFGLWLAGMLRAAAAEPPWPPDSGRDSAADDRRRPPFHEVELFPRPGTPTATRSRPG